MRRLERSLAILMVILAMFSVSGCDDVGTILTKVIKKTDKPIVEYTSSPTAEPIYASRTTLIVADSSHIYSTQSKGHEALCEELCKNAGWSAKAKLGGMMGEPEEVMEDILEGEAIVSMLAPDELSVYVPDYEILTMPYIFESYEDLNYLEETATYKEWEEEFRRDGIVLLSPCCYLGTRSIIGDREYKTTYNMTGEKVRTIGTSIYKETIDIMGGIPVGMNIEDAKKAARWSDVDAIDAQISSMYACELYEVKTTITKTEHIVMSGTIFTSAKWFDSLTEKEQKILKDAVSKVYYENQNIVENKIATEIKKMRNEQDTKVFSVDKAPFIKACNKMYEKLGMMEQKDKLQKELQEVKAKHQK